MELELRDQIAVICGSSRGIGKHIAIEFLKEGADVLISGREKSSLESSKRELQQKFPERNVRSFNGNLLESSELERLSKYIRSQFGHIDHLVCNLGSGKSKLPALEEKEDFSEMLKLNLIASSDIVRELRALLVASPLSKSGSSTMTFISSIAGFQFLGKEVPLGYSAAKSGLNHYAKCLSRILIEEGIRVNTVSPGNIYFVGSTWEKKLLENKEAVDSYVKAEVPANKLGNPEDIARAVTFISSPRSEFIIGSNFVVDGGQLR